MSQQAIVDFLKKYQPRWFNSNQLAEALQTSKSSINTCLGRMRKHSEINEKKMKTMLKGGKFGGFINKEVIFYSFKRL